ncbi:hypothetical protein CDAR_274391 [Caerostris darwini]|uniref:Uncharacterized protein n=1 Tax=Caerostris darwini TaxID=1538125 RepID=A0AAV4RD74_9ARAC|nr:hypothetical protein CDAR_274391 [Caerostris darwini]
MTKSGTAEQGGGRAMTPANHPRERFQQVMREDDTLRSNKPTRIGRHSREVLPAERPLPSVLIAGQHPPVKKYDSHTVTVRQKGERGVKKEDQRPLTIESVLGPLSKHDQGLGRFYFHLGFCEIGTMKRSGSRVCVSLREQRTQAKGASFRHLGLRGRSKPRAPAHEATRMSSQKRVKKPERSQ